MDILNVLLVLTLEQLLLFVAEDLANLPPISMDNFDMSSVIKDMDTIKKINEDSSRGARNLIVCSRNSLWWKITWGAVQPIENENEAVRSPAPSTAATPERFNPHTPTGSPPNRSPVTETPRTPMQHRRIDNGEGNDDDLLHLAQIQGRLLLTFPLHHWLQISQLRRNGSIGHDQQQHTWASAGGGGKRRPSPLLENLKRVEKKSKCTKNFNLQKAPIVCYARKFHHKRPPCYALKFYSKRSPCYALHFCLKRPPCYALIFF